MLHGESDILLIIDVVIDIQWVLYNVCVGGTGGDVFECLFIPASKIDCVVATFYLNISDIIFIHVALAMTSYVVFVCGQLCYLLTFRIVLLVLYLSSFLHSIHIVMTLPIVPHICSHRLTSLMPLCQISFYRFRCHPPCCLPCSPNFSTLHSSSHWFVHHSSLDVLLTSSFHRQPKFRPTGRILLRPVPFALLHLLIV